MTRFEVDGDGVTSREGTKPRTVMVSRSARDHVSGATASVEVTFEPGQGGAALRLLAGICLRLLASVRDQDKP